ncbi:transglycosylase family protein [Pseudonocardia sp. CA-107938]|uniref:transglycosylase family protein n=1 Tax=Pseudonocardia sp. CA-107938 TaxID=3240021 RepID=UPI003D8D6FDF
MTRRPGYNAGRKLLQIAVAGAVVVGTPVALAGTANAADDSTWDRLAQCESGGKWNINTGNGFSGGLQFTPSTWRAYGGSGSAHTASREEQIAVAERVLAGQGWGAWPSCSKKIGASGKAEPNKRVLAKAAPKPAAPKPAAPAAAAPAAPAVPVAKNGADYTVAAGDTLSKIATAQNVPGGWKAIFDRNADVISNPNLLKVGQQLDLR